MKQKNSFLATSRALPRAILFDLDGTLVDSIPDLAEATQRMLLELGEPTRSAQELTSFVGKGIGHLVWSALTVGRGDKTEVECQQALVVFGRHYVQTNGVKSSIYPGVVDTLTRLHERGIGLGCVTNKAEEFTTPLLQKLGLAKFFSVVVGGDTLPQKKPDPQPLWFACEKLGVAQQDVAMAALMVGDSANDALAARRAGMPVLLMTYGYSEGIPLEEIDGDGVMDSLTELESFF